MQKSLSAEWTPSRDFLSELYGQFNSGIYKPRKKLIDPTPENCAAFREFLIGKWADYPDALPTNIGQISETTDEVEALADEYDHMDEKAPQQTSMEQWTEVDEDGDLPF